VEGVLVLEKPPRPEPEPVPVPTEEEKRKALGAAVQIHLDTIAQERGYHSMLFLCSYAEDPHPLFAAEGKAGLVWRSAVWVKVGEVETEVLAGRRTLPTAEELIAELPKIVWPAEEE